MIPNVDDVLFLRHVLGHCLVQLLPHQSLSVVPQHVPTDSGGHLQDKHDDHKDGKSEDHAVGLADGSTASEKGDEEDDDADGDQEFGHREEVRCEEIRVVMEHPLHSGTHRYEDDSRDLQVR